MGAPRNWGFLGSSPEVAHLHSLCYLLLVLEQISWEKQLKGQLSGLTLAHYSRIWCITEGAAQSRTSVKPLTYTWADEQQRADRKWIRLETLRATP